MIARIHAGDNKVYLEPETNFESDYIQSLSGEGYLIGHIENTAPPDRKPIIVLEIKK